MVAYIYNSSTYEAEQGDFHKFGTSLGYIASAALSQNNLFPVSIFRKAIVANKINFDIHVI